MNPWLHFYNSLISGKKFSDGTLSISMKTRAIFNLWIRPLELFSLEGRKVIGFALQR